MDSIKSFKGYGKVNGIEDREFRRRTRRRIIIIGASSALLLLLIVGAAVGVVLCRKSDGSSDSSPSAGQSTATSQAIKAVCSITRYPDSCYSSLNSENGANLTSDPELLFKFSLDVAMHVLEKVASLPTQLSAETKDPRTKEALQICGEMIQDSIDQLNESLILMTPKPGEPLLSEVKLEDLKTWLSATITNQDTCLDGFENTTGGFRERMEVALRNSTEFTSNSLAIANKILGFLGKLGIPVHRKLLATAGEGLPNWVLADSNRRRLLQSTEGVVPDVVVAQDGTGRFKTIGEALALIPLKNTKRFVIQVKAGEYVEMVVVTKKMWNVVMLGDGVDKTIITGSLNFVDGTPTFNTATFVVEGKGFIAKGIAFKNTAGAAKHQAVAVRVKADQVVFSQCLFDAFQDTLYTHSFRQFYHQCEVRGTIDFIFGDASVVFQNCSILARQPLLNQFNTYTAQGRTDPGENTGISIQKCTVGAYGAVTAPTYLGRPWKPYSTTVIMTSEITEVVNPKGWISWDGVSDPPATIFYAEYQNTGLGAGTAGRVTWAGYKPALTDVQAQKYSVGTFIQGNEWLQDSGVVYELAV